MGRASARRRILDDFRDGLRGSRFPGGFETTDTKSSIYLPLTLHSGKTFVVGVEFVVAYEELEPHEVRDTHGQFERNTARTRLHLLTGDAWEVRESLTTIRKALEV